MGYIDGHRPPYWECLETPSFTEATTSTCEGASGSEGLMFKENHEAVSA